MKKIRPAALITGGAKRLGAAIAMHLAQKGYDIALHYNISKPEAMRTFRAIDRLGVGCELFNCNLMDELQVKELLPQVIKSFKGLSLLINSASVFVPNHFGDEDLSVFKLHWQVNYTAPYILSCAFNRLAKQGQIINFIDTNAVKYQTRYQDYLMTKKALGEFTKMAAVAWGPKVRVNGISPGMILPPVNHQKDARQLRAGKIPLRRIGDPSYILQGLDYLLTNAYVTGQIIAVDGGEGLV